MPTFHRFIHVLLVAPCILAAPFTTSRSAPGIVWSDCPNVSAPNLDCGAINVPLDYDKPDGETITIAMARLRANSSSRLGSLIYNPGGPGQPGSADILAVTQGAFLFSEDLTSHYDIIGIDPRGTGFSQPVQCDPSLWNPRVSFRPLNESQYDAMVAHNKAFGASCKAKTGALLDHLDTIHVAKDFELVRQALGEDKINYLGQSYGSHLGTTYAELFPENVGRMALDGITDHSATEIGFLTGAATTLEATMNKFFAWCDTTDDCALRGKDIAGIWDALIAQAQQSPIPAPGCVESGACRPDATAEEIIFMTKTSMHSLEENPLFGPGWPAVSAAIALAAAGNATLLSMPLTTIEADGLFSTIAISCQDWTRTANSSTEFVLREQMSATLAPHTLGFPPAEILMAACMQWPAAVTNPNHLLDQSKVSKLPPILLVHSLQDPATSIEWANSIRLQLPSSTLIIRDGVGHSSYQLGGDSAKAVDNYLINGVLPPPGTNYQS